jgi:hypothetical protein
MVRYVTLPDQYGLVFWAWGKGRVGKAILVSAVPPIMLMTERKASLRDFLWCFGLRQNRGS